MIFKKFPLGPLLASISFVVLSSLAFLFVLGKIEENNQAAKEAEASWQAEVNAQNEVSVVEQSLETIRADKAELETHFSRSGDVVPFLNTIERLAKESGTRAEVTLVDLSESRDLLTVSVNASGSFEAIYKFMILLENSPYELELTAVSMRKSSPEDAKQREWSSVFKLKLLTFLP